MCSRKYRRHVSFGYLGMPWFLFMIVPIFVFAHHFWMIGLIVLAIVMGGSFLMRTFSPVSIHEGHPHPSPRIHEPIRQYSQNRPQFYTQETYQEGGQYFQYPSGEQQMQYEQPQAQYPQQLPLQEQ